MAYDANLDALARDFKARMEKARAERTKDLDTQQKLFFTRSCCTSSYYATLVDGFKSGRFKKPSEFIEQELSWAFGTFLSSSPHHREALLWTVDRCTAFPYAEGWNRRPVRSREYLTYINIIVQYIRGFAARIDFCDDLYDLLSDNISEDRKAYLKYIYSANSGYLPVEIAYELDHGNVRIKELIRDMLCGEGNSQISHRIFRGIVMSRDTELHELLGKMLLAARLQEGLRQAICESCDEGTIEAFITILKVIDENNLIRFSSVKRAVGTWLGLISDESGDLSRISDKSLSLILECLTDPATREKHLASEDSMAIHIALWSYAVYEANDALSHIFHIAEQGTHHQVLTCGYTMHLFNSPELEYQIARTVISRHFDKQDILAAYIGGLSGKLSAVSHFQYDKGSDPANPLQIKRPEKSAYFTDDAQFEHFYGPFCTLYRTMKKKSIEFAPCIFPWNSEKLTKAAVAEVLCILARLSENDERIDFACTLLPETDVYRRSSLARMLLSVPRTPKQKDILTSLLGDRESSTREWAYKQLKTMDIDALNFPLIEDMLRFKTSDIRGRLVELLLRQSDSALLDSIRRLLVDKMEEKRCAALDLVLQVSRDENRSSLAEQCIPLVKDMTAKGSKEKVLLESVQSEILDKQESAVDMLCSAADEYIPVLPENTASYIEECITAFEECFPDSSIRKMLAGDLSALSDTSEGKCASALTADADIKSLAELVGQHKEDSYTTVYGQSSLLGYGTLNTKREPDGTLSIPLHELWDAWYESNHLSPIRLMRMNILLLVVGGPHGYGYEADSADDRLICALLGKGFTSNTPQSGTLISIVTYLLSKSPSEESFTQKLSFAVCWWMFKALPDHLLVRRRKENERVIRYVSDPDAEYTAHLNLITSVPHIAHILSNMLYQSCDNFDVIFAALSMFKDRLISIIRKEMNYPADRSVRIQADHYSSMHYSRYGTSRWHLPDIIAYLRAWHEGLISERTLYHFIFTSELVQNVTILTSISAFYHQTSASSRNSRQYWRAYTVRQSLEQLFGKTDGFTEEEQAYIAAINRIADTAADAIVTDELRRGDTPAPCSSAVPKIYKIYGIDRLVSILSALGNDALRDNVTSYSSNITRRSNLLSLLGSCVPDAVDTAEMLVKRLEGSGISRQRLIEAALYSPEWIDIIGECLSLPGFKSAAYYFMAHMNESFDDLRKAVIAQFTPLTADELNGGAFDLNWFRSAYDALGAEDFDRVYDAAKYITSGTLHMRARKYADAALGRLDVAQTEAQISDKRNKDLLMAYPVIPLAGDDDISRRYLFLQSFLKQSRQFGAQRIASEKAAVEIALTNLAINAGFSDVSRLTLRMESKLIEDKRALFVEQKIDDIGVCLICSDDGEVSVSVRKNGKSLKSVPAKYKKHELILALNEAKKMLTEQRSRTIRMMEEAMENSTAFTAEEIALLMKNPVLSPLMSRLVFLTGEQAGFAELNEDKLRLITSAGEVITLAKDAPLIVAHPWHLYKSGVWTALQRILFERGIVQPFKQVFRELYIKTADELSRTDSLRYAGNQIQPARTLGCLKSRRWVADVESGIQKIYYKENIIAHIFALADWFSPADIEAPTLEWVQFTDRRTSKPIKIDDVPDIIFSEVMRDVDMAVSVAHAGDVDPETSHSTIEMRAALLSFTLPLFKLTNVRVEKQHALIAGKLAEYAIHLGSGVIHQQGGAMISVLPVHSQHRGRIFLPFADDDPKTAEIISKVLLFAEDHKIKDPTILEQILR